MIKTKKKIVKTEEQIITKVYCDYCKKEFDKITVFCNGFGQISISFGYGSSFDDDSFNLQICDACFKKNFLKLVETQFKDKEYDLDTVKNSSFNNLKEFKK